MFSGQFTRDSSEVIIGKRDQRVAGLALEWPSPPLTHDQFHDEQTDAKTVIYKPAVQFTFSASFGRILVRKIELFDRRFDRVIHAVANSRVVSC